MQPPSVLVAQLRDYLTAGWESIDLQRLTVEHFLQPFSRHYFEQESLHTFATEWRAAHEAAAVPESAQLPAYSVEGNPPLTITELGYFMKQPVKQFFRRRLKVQFREHALTGMDDEPFSLDKLEQYQVGMELLADSGPPEPLHQVQDRLKEKLARMKREGRFPIGELAVKLQDELVEELAPVRLAWLALDACFPRCADKVRVTLRCAGLALEDWVDQIRDDGVGKVWMTLSVSRVRNSKSAKVDKKQLRADKLVDAYVRQLVLAAQGQAVTGYLVARDCIVQFQPLEQDAAQAWLDTLVALWQRGMDAPLPTACKTGLALVAKGAVDAHKAYEGATFRTDGMMAERDEPCLARLWADYGDLAAEPGHQEVSEVLYLPLLSWIASSVQIHPLNHMSEQAFAE